MNVRSFVSALGVALGSIPLHTPALAGTEDTMQTQLTARPAEEIVATVLPAGYRKSATRAVTVDGEPATLTRYSREDARNAGLGGEHFSTVIAADGRLKGFARIDMDLVGGPLPAREEARAIALDFLEEAAPDLLAGLKISWIEPHDETIAVTHYGKTQPVTLTGMKVKMRNTADGRWMWVIVGADRRVMVFERDIVWITFPGHRGTEKWLHDSWLETRGIGPDLGA